MDDHEKAVVEAISKMSKQRAVEFLSILLDAFRARMPVAAFDDLKAEAEAWAALATPHEMEFYLQEICQKSSELCLGLPARKNLFLHLWESLSAKDRHSFLVRVDPNGEFRRAA